MTGARRLPSIATWSEGGQLIRIEAIGRRFELFVHDSGSGPAVTMLHGFPTSSLEWSSVIGPLESTHRVLAPDFLGFGLSEKPNVDYSVGLQADLVEAMWKALNVRGGALVGYDYGGMVAMELLARHREGSLKFNPDRVVLLNSALFSDTYKPRLLTRLMATGPVSGLLGRAMNEKTVTRSWSEVFSDQHPLDAHVAALHWRALQENGSQRELRRLLHFVHERATNARRWDDALGKAEIPIRLIWGVEDLVSGSDAELVSTRLPDAQLQVMQGVGHAPHIEAPLEAGSLISKALSD